MEWIQAKWVSITAIVGGVVTIASVVVKLTPSTVDDAYLQKVIDVLKALSLAK